MAANIPGVTLHGKRIPQANKQLIDKIYRSRRLENIKMNDRTANQSPISASAPEADEN